MDICFHKKYYYECNRKIGYVACLFEGFILFIKQLKPIVDNKHAELIKQSMSTYQSYYVFCDEISISLIYKELYSTGYSDILSSVPITDHITQTIKLNYTNLN